MKTQMQISVFDSGSWIHLSLSRPCSIWCIDTYEYISNRASLFSAEAWHSVFKVCNSHLCMWIDFFFLNYIIISYVESLLVSTAFYTFRQGEINIYIVCVCNNIYIYIYILQCAFLFSVCSAWFACFCLSNEVACASPKTVIWRLCSKPSDLPKQALFQGIVVTLLLSEILFNGKISSSAALTLE